VYVYIWAYEVRPNTDEAFRGLYGHDGAWVALFRRAAGYIGTELLHDRNDPKRYVTIDRWESPDAHRAFRERFAAEFAELDRQGGALTTRETQLGEYDV
jgi:heme-degrading monooxygenase HmoA